MKIAMTARPRIRPPLPRLKEGGEQAVGEFGAGDDGRADSGQKQQDHVGVPQLATPDDREGDDQDRDHEAGRPQGGELGGNIEARIMRVSWLRHRMPGRPASAPG